MGVCKRNERAHKGPGGIDGLLLRIHTIVSEGVSATHEALAIRRKEVISGFSNVGVDAVGSEQLVCHGALSPKLAVSGTQI